MRKIKDGMSLHVFDPVPLHEVQGSLGEARDGQSLSLHQSVPVQPGVVGQHTDPLRLGLELVQKLRRMKQDLGRDAPDVEARPPDGLFLDQGDLCFYPARRPCLGTGAPDLPGQVGHELDFVLGDETVLPVVAAQPLVDETLVKVD